MSLLETRPVAATVYRGDSIEDTHLAHVAIVDASGRLLASFGDPSRMTLVRSAAKPAQALAVLETGALEHFGFDEADHALMCALHSSEPRHMLAKAQASEADLRCGGYPLQVRVKHMVAQVCDLPDEAVQWATDGCNLPTPAFPLDRLARLFAKLAAAQDEVSQSVSVTPRTAALARIYRAIAAYPELLGLLDIGTAEQRSKLASFHAPRMLNTIGVEIGRLAFSVALRDATGRT